MTDNERIERVQANIMKACSSFKNGSTATDSKCIETNKFKSWAQSIIIVLLCITIGFAIGRGVIYLIFDVLLPMMCHLFMEYIAPHGFIVGGIMGFIAAINEIIEENK